MTKATPAPATLGREPTEQEIREYAYHLYELRDFREGCDVQDWQEASACLKANIPRPYAV